jgi:general secretion pathway protein D
MLPPDIIRYSDDKRGFVVLSGEPEAVASAVDLMKSLDVNWLSSVSTALIPIENAGPAEIASDLDPVLSRLGGVSVIPLQRLGTLMVIARTREGLDQARQWIGRLDRDAQPQLMRDILVYEARYVNAEDLVALTDGGGNSSPPFQQAAYSNPTGLVDNYPPSAPTNTPVPALNYTSGASSLYENLSIRVDPGRNAIIARGASDELQSLKELLALLDKPKRQVLIEATIIEVSLSDGSSFGVQWDLVQDRLAAAFTDTSSGAITSLFPGVSVSYVNTDIAAVVNALATTSDVEIVSAPRMLVLNNETARLQIGDQVPIITQSAVSVADPGAPLVNSTSYRDTGVILTVTPRVRAGGMVEVDVSQEVSGVSETTTSTIDSPTISQRSVQSVLAVPDGSTAVLGGLMSSTRSYSQTGIPILKDTPVLGAAFRSTSQTERRTELIVLIEPTVVLSEEPDTNIPEQLRAALVRARGRFIE